MSTRAEYLGNRLILLYRREVEALRVLEEIRGQKDALLAEIRDMPTAEIYNSTAEIPIVREYHPAEEEPVLAPERFERRRNLGPVPMRSDHTDGGNTFHFNPTGDAVTETMPAPSPCPRSLGGTCPEIHPHIHTADGRVTAIRDL